MLTRPGRTALVAIVVSLVSQAIATSPLVGTGWDAFGRAIWMTILITLPAFAVACVFALIALVGWVRARR